VVTSEIGTFETFRDVRCLIGNGRKADVMRTDQFGRDWPRADVGWAHRLANLYVGELQELAARKIATFDQRSAPSEGSVVTAAVAPGRAQA